MYVLVSCYKKLYDLVLIVLMYCTFVLPAYKDHYLSSCDDVNVVNCQHTKYMYIFKMDAMFKHKEILLLIHVKDLQTFVTFEQTKNHIII